MASCKALQPCSFCKLQSAPASMSVSVAAVSPNLTAKWRGVSRLGTSRRSMMVEIASALASSAIEADSVRILDGSMSRGRPAIILVRAA